MNVKIALAGNPNSGKTTMFNTLTGSNQYVGNWPGVTVEKKEGRLKGRPDVVIQDLPGVYSASPPTRWRRSSTAELPRGASKPDAILNIVDASNIERNLYLTTQLTELGIPVVVALNMIDVVRKNGDTGSTSLQAQPLRWAARWWRPRRSRRFGSQGAALPRGGSGRRRYRCKARAAPRV